MSSKLGDVFLFAADTGSLSLESPQIEELCPSYLAPADNVDMIESGGMGREDSLDSGNHRQ